jgi:hypothetical protein
MSAEQLVGEVRWNAFKFGGSVGLEGLLDLCDTFQPYVQ